MKCGRGAAQWDLVNYSKFHKTINQAITKAEGKLIRPTASIDMKIRPAGGFQADKHLDAALRAKNISPEGLSREAKVYASLLGKTPLGGKKVHNIGGQPLEIIRKDTVGIALAGLIGAGASGTFIASQF